MFIYILYLFNMTKINEYLTFSVLLLFILSGCQQVKNSFVLSTIDQTNQVVTVKTLQLEYELLEKRIKDLENLLYETPEELTPISDSPTPKK